MTRPRLLDLFCGAGGAAVGYHRAGFDVTGVDINPQPRYPFTFIQADAMTYPLDGWDAIHASPPCQAYSRTQRFHNTRKDHPDLLPPTRDRLAASGILWIIENVEGAPLLPLVRLCGTSFGLGIPGYQLWRHRWFEISGVWMLSPPCEHRSQVMNHMNRRMPAIGIHGDHGGDKRRTDGYGRYFTLDERKQAMGIDWMARDELDQAIPPAYAEYIGGELLEHLKERAA
jgi:DNA (cytosine-5)-methyltransferase 1